MVPKLDVTGLTWRLDLRLAEDRLLYPLSLVGLTISAKSPDEVPAAGLGWGGVWCVHNLRNTSLEA